MSGRARVAAPAKAALLLAALRPHLGTIGRGVPSQRGAELPASAFLLAGVKPLEPARRGVSETAGWVLDLFARVERRRRILEGWEEPEIA